MDNFYSHAPRGARPASRSLIRMSGQFLLTRPSRGATRMSVNGSSDTEISTHTPLAGRDATGDAEQKWITISTHTPLAGRDQADRDSEAGFTYFYSHAPRGARPMDQSKSDCSG